MSSSDELLDVVDIDDCYLESRRRGEIHALGLMHRAVHILVFNSAGQLLLQKRSMQKDENPGMWDSSAAGHVDAGEDYLGCAIREIEEELGILPGNALDTLFKLPPQPETGNEHSMVYRCIHDGEIKCQDEEIAEICWLNPADMDQWVTAPDSGLTEIIRQIWHRYRRLDVQAI